MEINKSYIKVRQKQRRLILKNYKIIMVARAVKKQFEVLHIIEIN